jgi:hypothetical protein
MKFQLAMMLALACLGCTAPENEDEYPPLLDQPGDPCRSPYPTCLDDEMVRECVDEIWIDRSCDESCADIGPAMLSMGCVVEGPLEGCACIPEPGACAPGMTACESASELGYCDGAQVWIVYDCDSLCASSLATPVSQGCVVDEDSEAACWCVAA